jgi:hypothetical protein
MAATVTSALNLRFTSLLQNAIGLAAAQASIEKSVIVSHRQRRRRQPGGPHLLRGGEVHLGLDRHRPERLARRRPRCAVVFVRVKALLVSVDAASVSNLVVGGDANAALIGFGAVAHTITLHPGGAYLIFAPLATGYPITGGHRRHPPVRAERRLRSVRLRGPRSERVITRGPGKQDWTIEETDHVERSHFHGHPDPAGALRQPGRLRDGRRDHRDRSGRNEPEQDRDVDAQRRQRVATCSGCSARRIRRSRSTTSPGDATHVNVLADIVNNVKNYWRILFPSGKVRYGAAYVQQFKFDVAPVDGKQGASIAITWASTVSEA